MKAYYGVPIIEPAKIRNRCVVRRSIEIDVELGVSGCIAIVVPIHRSSYDSRAINANYAGVLDSGGSVAKRFRRSDRIRWKSQTAERCRSELGIPTETVGHGSGSQTCKLIERVFILSS